MHVPYFDLKSQYRGLRDEILGALDRVCGDAAFILGEDVAQFEREFAAYCEAAHCVAVNSGTSALHLALLGLRRRARATRSSPRPHTFIATAEAISYVGRHGRCSSTSTRAPTTSTRRGSRRPSRRAPGPSCRCTSTASRPTWTRSSRSADAGTASR